MDSHFDTTHKKRTTVGNITFLLLSFPLGLTYFLLTVIGFSVGVGTIVVWVGLPILFATLVLIRGMAAVERRMASTLLHVAFPYRLHRHATPQQGLLQRFGSILRDPLTWTSTIYMILKFPLGIISFTLALTLPITSIAITALPLTYLINLFVNEILLMNGIHSTGIIIPYFIEVGTHFDLVMFARTFIGIPVGIGLWYVTSLLLNGLALFSGEMARALLSPGEVDMMAQPHQVYATPMYQEQLHVYASGEPND